MADWNLKIIKHEVIDDDWPDLSYLGEYADNIPAGTDEDCVILLDADEEWRYFVANVPLDAVNAQTGKPYTRRTKQRYARQQYERMERYNDNDWSMAGLYVEAIVTNDNDDRLFSTRSSGLWNVENDSGKEYYESIWAEEMVEITERLAEITAITITPEQIAEAIKYAEEV